MARKKGGFSRVLEFIGLVDDEEPRDNYEDEYDSGNDGRRPAYQPKRSTQPTQPTRSRQEVSRRYSASSSSYEPTRTPRMSRTPSRFDSASASSSPRRLYNEERPTSSASRYDYSPRPSRFDSSTQVEEPVQRSTKAQAASRQRTMMFALHELRDCCDVIDNLILNNTVVLTMDDLDPKIMQRAVDTLSGAVFALHATIRKASDRTYLIAPMNVEVNENYDVDHRF